MDEVRVAEQSPACSNEEGCQCNSSTEAKVSGVMTAQRGNEETALAFLLALMPLVALTFFGQAGLI